MAKDPVLIRRTSTVEEADIIVAWLSDQGVEALVSDRDNAGVMAFGVTDTEGIEIYVSDAEAAARAGELLAEHDKQNAPGESNGDAMSVEVSCEDCGKKNLFPATATESVRVCPECGAHLDIPGTGK